MEVIEEIRSHLSIFTNMYDQIRVIDPNSKEVVLFYDESKELSRQKCSTIWDKDTFCENCISLRAYEGMDTVFKIEKRNEKLVFVTATPALLHGKTYVVELMKEMKVDEDINSNLDNNEMTELIYEVNKKVMKDSLVGAN